MPTALPEGGTTCSACQVGKAWLRVEAHHQRTATGGILCHPGGVRGAMHGACPHRRTGAWGGHAQVRNPRCLSGQTIDLTRKQPSASQLRAHQPSPVLGTASVQGWRFCEQLAGQHRLAIKN